MSCKECRWYKPLPIGMANYSKRGECHRYPPKVMMIGDNIVEVYPKVAENNTCGEGSSVDDEANRVVQK